jgi:hypothetical protein
MSWFFLQRKSEKYFFNIARYLRSVRATGGRPHHFLFADHGAKLYLITPETLTGWPESFVGLNLARRAAETAAAFKSGWPLAALAETTLPSSSIST